MLEKSFKEKGRKFEMKNRKKRYYIKRIVSLKRLEMIICMLQLELFQLTKIIKNLQAIEKMNKK